MVGIFKVKACQLLPFSTVFNLTIIFSSTSLQLKYTVCRITMRSNHILWRILNLTWSHRILSKTWLKCINISSDTMWMVRNILQGLLVWIIWMGQIILTLLFKFWMESKFLGSSSCWSSNLKILCFKSSECWWKKCGTVSNSKVV